MPRFRVTKKSFINNRIVQPGKIVEVNLPKGKSASNLEPIREPKAAKPAEGGDDQKPAEGGDQKPAEGGDDKLA